MADYPLKDHLGFADTVSVWGPKWVDSWAWSDWDSVNRLVDAFAWADEVTVDPVKRYTLIDHLDYADSVTVDTSSLDDYVSISGVSGLDEEQRARRMRKEVREYGTVLIYERRFIARGKYATEDFGNGVLALGEPMRKEWASFDDEPSRWIDGPRVLNTVRHQQEGGAQDALDVIFLGFILPTGLSSGYNETARSDRGVEDVFLDAIVTWGITPGYHELMNNPTKGDILDRSYGLDAYRCQRVEFIEDRLPGRILVRAIWARRPRGGDLLKASDVVS